MFQSIKNVYCVGRNYRQHAAELGNAVPDKPMLFMKPTHSLVAMDGRTIVLPGGRGEIHYEAELVIHIGRQYEPGIHADDLIDRMALGIDFTLRDVQSVIKQKGQPWLPAKGFLQSAPLGPFRPFAGAGQIAQETFRLLKNGETVQVGQPGDMIFDLQSIIDFCAAHYGIGPGDLIFTGTPAGVGAVADGDRLQLLWGEEPAGDIRISIPTS
ncbi:fumarylacetoacetate hydrolase family protein [Paenibacillus sp. J2TS4]|uniref:fumarylacetoacetate hydrolase family protein n=1 Tax=Paenibacillus sp. J2TS4 TaxID=2807194 RepID=UPI001B1C436F|nr:fumarylacetoacetate hydrolase family protein [Paenibacillus sp. J2TS4]GIP33839.1 fumarylacetoacetate hydrolase [Paenibacillus sp. J2TS4]